MRLVKIKNSYMYQGNNPNGTHVYATYYDKRSRETRAVQLTHLYVRDERRFSQVQHNRICVEKFKEFDVPSGVRNEYYHKNVHGGAINLNDRHNVRFLSNRYLSKSQSERIKRFARNRRP